MRVGQLSAVVLQTNYGRFGGDDHVIEFVDHEEFSPNISTSSEHFFCKRLRSPRNSFQTTSTLRTRTEVTSHDDEVGEIHRTIGIEVAVSKYGVLRLSVVVCE